MITTYLDKLWYRGEVNYRDAYGELMELIQEGPEQGSEETLRWVLGWGNKHFRFAKNNELPHSMPPESMLQSLAAQALVRWHLQQKKDLEEMLNKLRDTTETPALRSTLEALLEQLHSG